MVTEAFRKKLAGYSLTTAEILYHMPDHPHLIQSYVWQDFDLHPHFPELHKFLGFWQDTLDGPLHSVQVAHRKLIKPTEIALVGTEYRLH